MVVEIDAPDGSDAVEWVGETLEGENVGFDVTKLDIVGISEV